MIESSDRPRVHIEAPPISERGDEERLPSPLPVTDADGGDDPCVPVPERLARRQELLICRPQRFLPPLWLESLLDETHDAHAILTTLRDKLLERDPETSPAIALGILNAVGKEGDNGELINRVFTTELFKELSQREGDSNAW